MAKKSTSAEPQPPVVVGVFEDFLKRIAADSSFDPSLTTRLRKTLLEDQDPSVDALRAALFSEEPLP